MSVSVNGGPLTFEFLGEFQQLNNTIKQIESQIQGLTKTSEQEANAIDRLANRAAAGIASYFSVIQASNFIQDIVKVRGEFEQLEVAFRTMLKSKSESDKLLAQVTQLAATTPFQLQDVASGAKQLLAYSFSATEVIDTLKNLGNIAAGVGAPLSDIVYLFGTLRTQGRAFEIDIRQFAQRGIPIYTELAKVLHTSVDQVNDFVSAGKVGFPEVEQAFKNMTSEGGIFFNLMQEQSKTLTGQISNLKDAWSIMLNDIGKSNEGIFTGAIEGAAFLVKNYQDVLDVLKVLIITFGSYKAAVIATNIATAVSTDLAKGYTIAELLRYRAIALTEGIMKLLNKTMLSNPFVLVTTAVGALVSAFTLFKSKTDDVKTSQQLLADSEKNVSDKMSEAESKIRPYIDALKNANISETERLNIYNKLKEISPDIIKGIDAQKLSYQSLTDNVNAYLDALRNQYKLEANKDALQASIKQEKQLQDNLNKAKKDVELYRHAIDDINRNLSSGAGQGAEGIIISLNEAQSDVERFTKALDDQKKITQSLGETQLTSETQTQEAKKRTLQVIDDEIKSEKEKQEKFSTTSKEFTDYQKRINDLEAERAKIAGQSKEAINQQNKLQDKSNQLLDKRKSLLQDMSDLETESRQSGLLQEQSEIDKINQKFDKTIQNIADFNKKIDEFNQKNKTNLQGIGQLDIDALNKARGQEISNVIQKQNADKYKAGLEDQVKVFADYEDAKKQIGIQKSNELFASERHGFDSLIAFLKSERDKLLPKISLGIANIEEVEKFKALNDAINKADKDNADNKLKLQVQNFNDLLNAAITYKDKEKAINKKYDDLEATLQKDNTLTEKNDRMKILEDGRKEELNGLQNDLIRQSDLYKKLNQDIIGFTRDRIKQEIKDLKDKLKNDTSLTPEEQTAINNALSQYQDLLTETNKTVANFNKIHDRLSSISQIFGSLASDIKDVNSGLSDTLQTLSDLANIGSQAAGAVAGFASGTPQGIISAIQDVVGVVGGIIKLFSKSSQSAKQAKQDLQNYQDQLVQGELDYQEALRDRERQQVTLNKLTLQGLEDQKKLLEQQKQANQQSYNDILAQLQQLSFIESETTKKSGGIFGLFSTTEVQKQYASLAGMTYDQLEQLFDQGRLEGKAKDLFEELQKLKQEGEDIDSILADNAEKFKEAITGTTAESITDSIVQGFEAGKTSASDFADTFQQLMQQALLQSLKLKYLEGPLNDFFDEFASLSDSDGQLTNGEIQQLQDMFNTIISNANTQFQQLQQIAGININGLDNESNSLSGAIKGITEDQADLLAGQFGGLRLTALDQLNVARSSLITLNNIQTHTAAAVDRLESLLSKMDNYETGARKLHVQI